MTEFMAAQLFLLVFGAVALYRVVLWAVRAFYRTSGGIDAVRMDREIWQEVERLAARARRRQSRDPLARAADPAASGAGVAAEGPAGRLTFDPEATEPPEEPDTPLRAGRQLGRRHIRVVSPPKRLVPWDGKLH